jgi:hypothetical protein
VKMQTQRMKAMKTRKTMMMTRVTRTNIEWWRPWREH